MSREPIRLQPRTYKGPLTVDGLMRWLDEFYADSARVLESNLLIALNAGELSDVDSIDAALDEAKRMADEAREQIRRQLIALMSTSRPAERSTDTLAPLARN
jgi:hypothetical protein